MRVLIAALVVAALVVLLWILQENTGARLSAASAPADARSTDSDRASAGTTARPADRVKDRGREHPTAANASTARLLVEVADAKGGAVDGMVYWHSTAAVPLTPLLLGPDLGTPPPKDIGASEKPHTGAAVLDVPVSSWTWLRATSTRPGGALSGYARVPPFVGEHRLRLELSDGTRRIHAFVLGPDLTAGAPDEEVTLYRLDMRQTPAPERVERKRTDAHGYVCFDRVAPDGYMVCTAGAAPTDRFPRVARIMLPPGMPPSEMPLTLVSFGSGTAVRLKIRAPTDLPATPQAMLYLRSRNAHGSQPMPVTKAVLTAGVQETECTIAAGDYDLGVVPQGWLECLEGTGQLTVRTGTTEHEVRLGRSGATSRVTLTDLPAGAFPVQVSQRPSGGICPPYSELLFCGPYHWRSPTETVALGQEPRRLVAVGKTGAWTSNGNLPTGAAVMDVPMRPASQVHVRWRRQGPCEPSVLTLRSNNFESRVQMTRELIVLRGDTMVGWAGREVVPAGALELSVSPAAGGGPVWSASCKAEKALVLVTVDEERGNAVEFEHR